MSFGAPHSGEGRAKFPSGDVYEGQWLNGKRHGIGTYVWNFSRGQYAGEWQHSYQHGHGVRTYPNGDEYDGEWQLDNRDGQGIMRHANGDQYNGGWIDDRMEVRAASL
jgi:hypothetical protein